MKLGPVAAIVLAGALLGGCVTSSEIASIHTGMTRAGVVDTLGKPYANQARGRYEELTYIRQGLGDWRVQRSEYYVLLNDGRVVAFGPGDGAPRPAGALKLAPNAR